MRNFNKSFASFFCASRCTCFFLAVAVATLLSSAAMSPARAQMSAQLTAGLQFDSVGGNVRLDDEFSLAERSFTVEAWIWLDHTTGDQPILAQLGSDKILHLIVRNGRLYFGFWTDDLEGASTLPAGEWIHVAYAYDLETEEQRVYLNGALDGQRVANGLFPENDRPLYLGQLYTLGVDGFAGRMLEVRIWDRALTEAEIEAGRFVTPAVETSGLEALFTFEEIDGDNVPDAAGTYTENVLSDLTVVTGVLAPSAWSDPTLTVDVPAGSLRDALAAYSISPAPHAPFDDAGGTQLSDGVVPPILIWDEPWPDVTGAWAEPLVAWSDAAADLTFIFEERVHVDRITLHALSNDVVDGIALPARIQVRSPGGFERELNVAPIDENRAIQALTLDDLELLTGELTLTIHNAGNMFALAEVAFDGTRVVERPTDNDGLSLAAQRYFGLDPAADDAAQLDIGTETDELAARFRFPEAADTYGVQAHLQWSEDLATWQPIAHAPAGVSGRNVAELTPPPESGRAFFRLRFTEPVPESAEPLAFALNQNDAPVDLTTAGLLDAISSPYSADDFRIVAINDRPVASESTFTTKGGGSIQIAADGSMTYVASKAAMAGETIMDSITYTVANRLGGGSMRNTINFNVTGEDDPPVATSPTLSLTQDEVLAISHSDLFTDPDKNDTHTFTSVNGAAPPAIGVPLALTHGTLVLLADGSFSYTPDPALVALPKGSTASETFTYTVTDSTDLSASGTATLVVVGLNDAPVAEDDFFRYDQLGERLPGLWLRRETGAFADFSTISDTEHAELYQYGIETEEEPPLDPWVLIGPTGQYADVLDGFIDIPETGNYTFSLQGGFKAELRIDDQIVATLDSDPAGAPVTVDGTITLEAGTHPIELRHIVATPAGFTPTEVTLELSCVKDEADTPAPLPLAAQLFWNRPFSTTYDPLANDTDVDTGDTLSITHIDGQPFDTSFELNSGAVIQRLEDGTLEYSNYQPQSEAVFIDTFELTTTDSHGASDTSTTTVEVIAHQHEEFSLTADSSTYAYSYFTLSNPSPEPFIYTSAIKGVLQGPFRMRPQSTYRIKTEYNVGVSLLQAKRLLFSLQANLTTLDPVFRENFVVQPICSSDGMARFSIENNNDEDVVITVVGNPGTISVNAGESREFEVTYASQVVVKVRDAILDVVFPGDAPCGADFDFTVDSLCTSTNVAWLSVTNNNENDSYTIRLQSKLISSLATSYEEISPNQTKTFSINSQGFDLGGTEGVLYFKLDGEIIEGATFTFTEEDDGC